MRANVFLRQWQTKKGDKRYFLVVRESGKKDQTVHLGQVTRKVAEQRKYEVLKEVMNNVFGYTSEARVFFSDFCDKFLNEFATGNRHPGTVRKYYYTLRIAKRAFHGLMLDQISTYRVEQFLNGWKVKGCTKNIMLSVLRVVFQKAVDWRYLSKSAAHEIRRFREERQGSRSLTMSELASLLRVARPWERSLITVMVYSGLRPGEVSRLKFEHVDWENKQLRVFASKTGKTRFIPLFPELEETLRHLKEWRPNQQVGSTTGQEEYLPRTPEQGEYIFCQPDGKLCKCFRRSLVGAFRRAGIEGVSPHGLRKTFCSLLARYGVHPRAAQRLMGHSDINLTMNVYTEIADDQLRDAVNALPSTREVQRTALRVVQ